MRGVVFKMYNDSIFTVDACISLGPTWLFCNIILFDQVHSISRLAPYSRRVDFTGRRFFPVPLSKVGGVQS